MVRAHALTEPRRALVLGNYLHWSIEAVRAGYLGTGLAIWSRSRKCGLTSGQMLWGWLFLLTCRSWLGPLFFFRLMADWPREGFILTRRGLARPPTEHMIALTDADHPLQRYAGPIREGFWKYILRRLHPRKVFQVLLRDLGRKQAQSPRPEMESAHVAME
jgi:hypothetical protein